MIIEAKNIRRTFRSTKKEEGIKGSLKLLFNPQYQEHEALKDISFSIEEGSFNGLNVKCLPVRFPSHSQVRMA